MWAVIIYVYIKGTGSVSTSVVSGFNTEAKATTAAAAIAAAATPSWGNEFKVSIKTVVVVVT